MKREEIKVGGKYRAKVNSKITTVRVDAIREFNPTSGYNRIRPTNTQYRYDVTNLATGVKLTFNQGRFRGLVELLKKD